MMDNARQVFKDDYIDASDLGWRPGSWQGSLVYRGQTMHLFRTHRDTEGDIIKVEYRSSDGANVLYVVND